MLRKMLLAGLLDHYYQKQVLAGHSCITPVHINMQHFYC